MDSILVGADLEPQNLVPRDWLLRLAGAISVAFGAVLVAFPVKGALAVAAFIAAHAVAFGSLPCRLGAELHHLQG